MKRVAHATRERMRTGMNHRPQDPGQREPFCRRKLLPAIDHPVWHQPPSDTNVCCSGVSSENPPVVPPVPAGTLVVGGAAGRWSAW